MVEQFSKQAIDEAIAYCNKVHEMELDGICEDIVDWYCKKLSRDGKSYNEVEFFKWYCEVFNKHLFNMFTKYYGENAV